MLGLGLDGEAALEEADCELEGQDFWGLLQFKFEGLLDMGLVESGLDSLLSSALRSQ